MAAGMKAKSLRSSIVSRAILLVGILLTAAGASAQVDRPKRLVPEHATLSHLAREVINEEWLTPAERSALRVFHGVWDERDLVTPHARAFVALNAWRFDDPAFDDPSVEPELRAEALLRRGDVRGAIELLRDVRGEDGEVSMAAGRILAEAFEEIGAEAEARRVADAVVQSLQAERTGSAAHLTEGVRAMLVRARLVGQPSRDFQSMMALLARAHQQLDRLYWPAKLAEARLLLDKDNMKEAVQALHETLALNPRSADTWYELGRVALQRFDFDSANVAAEALRRIDSSHPLAELLAAESRLVQDDPDGALELLAPVRHRWPRLRRAIALEAAARAIMYDETRMREAIAAYEALSPGSAIPYFETGRVLSLNRQYGIAAEMLDEAVRRRPAWPAPQIELGLLELQSGRDARAFAVLHDVVALDPFNKRAANSLALLEELIEYTEVESEHFIVRYRPGIDQVMADMMIEPLERIHDLVSTRFDWRPEQKTVIELYPDHERFSVRITGMPWIHTVAAATGPVIALEAPREGPPSLHLGVFDWRRVIQHEYTHTITLDQTRNRIPHWLTEAAAVSMELAPRTYDRCVMLAEAWREGTLFDLDEIKWAFVRPKRPGDRSKAYAQGHWMVEYMNERFGESALVRLLQRYYDGEREADAIPNALGISREQFYRDFLEWAGIQVRRWGLDARPTFTELADELRWDDPETATMMAASQQARLDAIVRALTDQIGRPARPLERGLTANDWPPLVRPEIEVTEDRLESWLEQHPDHPDLVELQLRRTIEARGGRADESTVPLLERYARLRPVDPYPHKKLAELWLASATPERAIPHLEELDIREEKTPIYALELSKLYRRTGDLERALAKAIRALQIDPYNAYSRELAAGTAIEAGRLDVARRHIVALTILEPDRPQHGRRLEAIERLIREHEGG